MSTEQEQNKTPTVNNTLSLATERILELERQVAAAVDMVEIYKAMIEEMAHQLTRANNVIREAELEEEWGCYDQDELYDMYFNDPTKGLAKDIDEYGETQWGDWEGDKIKYQQRHNP